MSITKFLKYRLSCHLLLKKKKAMMQVLTQFLPLDICQVWGKEVLATPEGIALRLETFMWANENKRPTM